MSAVKISGTFKKDSRPDNGLEAIAEQLAKDEFARHTVIGVLELHKVVKEPGEAPEPTVRFIALEPLEGEAAGQAMQLLNAARKTRGQSALSGTLFDPSGADETDGGDQADPDEDDDAGPATSRPADEWLDDQPETKPKRARR